MPDSLISNLEDFNNMGDVERGTGTSLSDVFSQGASLDGISPPNGCSLIQRLSLDNLHGQSVGTGYRTMFRRSEPITHYASGYDSTWVWWDRKPSGFPSVSMFNALWEMHQSGSDTGVPPMHSFWRTSSTRQVDCAGGTTGAGGIGNPGRVFAAGGNATFSDQPGQPARYGVANVGIVHAVRCRHGFKDDPDPSKRGMYQCWIGRVGVDNSLIQIIDAQNVTNLFGTRTNYLLFGLYNNGGPLTRMYCAGLREYGLAADALARGAVLLGGVATPPDSTPPTVPSALHSNTVTANSIQVAWTASTDSESGVAGYRVYIGGVLVGTVTVGTAFQANGLNPSTSYSFQVEAFDNQANVSAKTSALVVATPAGSPPDPPPPDPRPLPPGFLGGYHDLGLTTPQGQNANSRRAVRIPVTVSGIATHVGTYRKPAASGAAAQVSTFAVHDGSNSDPDNGVPPQAVSEELTVHQGDPEGDYLLPLDTPVQVIAGETPWIEEAAGAQSNVSMTQKGAGLQVLRYISPATYTGPPGMGPWNTAADAAFSDVATLVWLEGVPGGVITPPPGPPVNTRLPVIQGVVQEGHVLTCDPGDWSPEGLTLDFRWFFDFQTDNNQPRSGLTQLLLPTDVGKTVAVRVIGTTANGTLQVFTDQSELVLPASTVITGRIIAVRGPATRIVNPSGRRALEGGGGG